MRIEMENNKIGVVDMILNLTFLVYPIYRWMLFMGISGARVGGEEVVFMIAPTLLLFIFFIIDILSLRPVQHRQEEFLWSGYVRLSIAVKAIALVFLIASIIVSL
ncbi:MAG: hypothetical protein K6A30_02775 [Lachnospiraceae bacterium]|nr:hypothetical protein [Lachnospiraceae bacterium]